MSLAQVEDKLKEFFYYVSASTANWLSKAYDTLGKFYEGVIARTDLMSYIRLAIENSLAQAVGEGVIDVDTALHLFGSIMMYYGSKLDKITVDADINAFIEFLNEVIRILSVDRRYVEWARKSWEGAVEILRAIFKI